MGESEEIVYRKGKIVHGKIEKQKKIVSRKQK